MNATGKDIALLMTVFFKNGFAFGFTDLLNDDLFGGLRGNTTETGIVDLFAVESHGNAEGLGIDLNVKGISFFRRSLAAGGDQGVTERVQEDLFGNPLLFFNIFQRSQ